MGTSELDSYWTQVFGTLEDAPYNPSALACNAFGNTQPPEGTQQPRDEPKKEAPKLQTLPAAEPKSQTPPATAPKLQISLPQETARTIIDTAKSLLKVVLDEYAKVAQKQSGRKSCTKKIRNNISSQRPKPELANVEKPLQQILLIPKPSPEAVYKPQTLVV